jgi:hypothetical protein
VDRLPAPTAVFKLRFFFRRTMSSSLSAAIQGEREKRQALLSLVRGDSAPAPDSGSLHTNGDGTFDPATGSQRQRQMGWLSERHNSWTVWQSWRSPRRWRLGRHGKAKIGVFRPDTGQWFLDMNGNGKLDDCTVDACLGPFGQEGDLPVVGKW